MRKIIYFALAIVFGFSFNSCSLDETNYTQVDQETAFTSEAGFQGAVNACYENLYYLYGKIDGIGNMEMGCDLWMYANQSGGYSAYTHYNNSELNCVNGPNQVVWNALYAMVGYCNTAIYYFNKNFNDTEHMSKVAEAHFLRGFALFHIVEQYGDVVLDTLSIAEVGAGRENAYRSSEEDFYNQIISDLEYAAKYLPKTQSENGRATSVAAKAMLAKAWLQRTRLYTSKQHDRKGKAYPEDAEMYKKCAQEAFNWAKQVTEEAELYPSDATSSGSTKCWDGANNKTNKEFLFREAIDHISGMNPESWNRGRTAQYYQMSSSGASQYFGISSDGIRYRRQNVQIYTPTLYLLTKCFEPKEDTPDSRFGDSFYYKYYIGTPTYDVLQSNAAKFGKDTTLWITVNPRTKVKSFKCQIIGNVATAAQLKTNYPGMSYYADNDATWGGSYTFELENKDDALGCFVPNWPLDSAWIAHQKFLCANLTTQIFNEDGSFSSQTQYKSLMPSLKKFSCLQYCYDNQSWLGDFPIIRTTDIYLVAAEAAILMGEPAKGLDFLNTVRKHAAKSTDAGKMIVGQECMTIDYILKERARELCGEQWRWYDMKRTGNISEEFLNNQKSHEPRNPYVTTIQPRNVVRPIPQQFLDQIANADEFGTNGY